MATIFTHAYVLRAIGQALEERKLQDFDLEVSDSEFVVRGKVLRQPSKIVFLRSAIERLQRRTEGFVELCYTAEDVERLDHEGQLKRRDPAGVPDFYSLPQTLRAVGDYVDRKGARLLALYKRGLKLTLEYQKGRGRRVTEERAIPYFYDLFVSMYLRRGDRRRVRG